MGRNQIVRRDRGTGSEEVALHGLVDRALAYAAEARSPATRRAYESDWKRFVAWCRAQKCTAMPADPRAVALYLAERADAGRKVSTIERELSAISEAHRRKNQPSPRAHVAVQEVLKGIRRTLGTKPRQAAALGIEDLRKLAIACPISSLKGLRDRAILTLGFAGALRRSEIVGLDVGDVSFEGQGAKVTVRRSKTDQEASGTTVAIPYGANPVTCPVRSVQAWIRASDVTEGPLFRSVNRHGRVGARLSGNDVARLLKSLADAAGIPSESVSGHSLRAGFATEAARVGKNDRAIMRHGRWKSRATVDRYVREGQIFDDNPAAGIGL